MSIFTSTEAQMTTEATDGSRETLWEQMAEHTKPMCGAACRNTRKYRCCERIYCEMAIDLAKEEGTELALSGMVPELPGMGPNGCEIPPRLRPLCTMHQCAINSWGVVPGHVEWTKRYFELREALNDLELGE